MRIFNIYLLFILSAYSDDFNIKTFDRSLLFQLYYSYLINDLPLLYEKYNMSPLVICYLFPCGFPWLSKGSFIQKKYLYLVYHPLTKKYMGHSPFSFPQHLILWTLNTAHGKDEKRNKGQGIGSRKRRKKKK